jgi:hypothetical protein
MGASSSVLGSSKRPQRAGLSSDGPEAPGTPGGATAVPPASDAALNACKREACFIQDCLAANGYQEAACVSAIASLIACCDAAAGAAPPGTPAPVQCSFSARYRQLAGAAAAGR